MGRCCRKATCLTCFLLLARFGLVYPFHAETAPGTFSKRRSAIFSDGRTRRCATQPTSLQIAAVGTAIDTLFQSSPYATAAITCGIKASSADWIAQKRQCRMRDQTKITTIPEGSASGKMDRQRNIAFLLYGALYQGAAQEFIYNHIYPTLFGFGNSVPVVLSKVAFDLFVQTTILTLPIAYLTKALIYKYSAREAMRRYLDDIQNHGLLIKYFSLWGPVQCVTFSVIPEHYRITFIACVSFFWLIILSTISARPPKLKFTPDRTDKQAIPECELVDGLTCNIDG